MSNNQIDRWMMGLDPGTAPLPRRIRLGQPLQRCVRWRTEPGKDEARAKELFAEAARLSREELDAFEALGFTLERYAYAELCGTKCTAAWRLHQEALALADKEVCEEWDPPTPPTIEWGMAGREGNGS